MKIRPAGTKSFRVGGRTEIHDEANFFFREILQTYLQIENCDLPSVSTFHY